MRQYGPGLRAGPGPRGPVEYRWPYPAGGAQTLSIVFGLMFPVCSDTPEVEVDFDAPCSDAGVSQSTPKGGKGEIHSTPVHVNQYVAGVSLPATAWPRQTLTALRRARLVV